MISAVILTKNESKDIKKCLDSVKWCDETIVLDDNSSDKTLEIAKKYNARIFNTALKGNFSKQRNLGLSKALNEWVLFLDADEVLSDSLIYEISNAVESGNKRMEGFNGFFIKRVDFMWGKELKHGETGNKYFLRLGRKDLGLWKGAVHEKWVVKGKTGKLLHPIYHYPHENLEEFIKKINYYTDLRAEELKSKKVKVNFLSILSYPLGKFILNYFVKKGFLDGDRGIIHAIMMSFHSFLVRGKLWKKYN
jgi:glycosyltransferase involved in cell wall biosynthesis